MRVAFMGLGIMGHAMATNLVKAGHEVTVWNRTPGKLVEGAGVAPTPAAAAQGAEVVWLCVSDTAAVEQILFGADGIEQSLADGMIIADSSTISPSATVSLPSAFAAKGVAYVDAPMTGSKIGAAQWHTDFHGRRRRSRHRPPQPPVRRYGQEDFPHGRDRQRPGHEAGHEPADCPNLRRVRRGPYSRHQTGRRSRSSCCR